LTDWENKILFNPVDPSGWTECSSAQVESKVQRPQKLQQLLLARLKPPLLESASFSESGTTRLGSQAQFS
jgi:hypothetical protein